MAWLAVEAKNKLKPLASLTMIEFELKGEDNEPLDALRAKRLQLALYSRVRPAFDSSH